MTSITRAKSRSNERTERGVFRVRELAGRSGPLPRSRITQGLVHQDTGRGGALSRGCRRLVKSEKQANRVVGDHLVRHEEGANNTAEGLQ